MREKKVEKVSARREGLGEKRERERERGRNERVEREMGKKLG